MIVYKDHLCNPGNSFREEDEKFNVWIALLNLENSYGTQDSLVKVFQRALEQNEPKKVFEHLVTIYKRSSKFEVLYKLCFTFNVFKYTSVIYMMSSFLMSLFVKC